MVAASPAPDMLLNARDPEQGGVAAVHVAGGFVKGGGEGGLISLGCLFVVGVSPNRFHKKKCNLSRVVGVGSALDVML